MAAEIVDAIIDFLHESTLFQTADIYNPVVFWRNMAANYVYYAQRIHHYGIAEIVEVCKTNCPYEIPIDNCICVLRWKILINFDADQYDRLAIDFGSATRNEYKNSGQLSNKLNPE